MPIAGSVIIINSLDKQRAKDLALSIRDTEKNQAYFHIGHSTLKEHFVANNQPSTQPFTKALYAAISASARCGANLICDLCIHTQAEYDTLQLFIADLDCIWINIGITTPFVKSNLQLNETQSIESMTNSVITHLAQRYQNAMSFARWSPEACPAPKASNPGNIILLIGASSAGKSTLTQTIQDTANTPYLKVGIDTVLLYYLHLRYLSGVPEYEGDDSWKTPNFNPTIDHQLGSSWVAPGPNGNNPYEHLRYRVGPVARLAYSTMYATMAEMSRQGFNVVSDHCFHFDNAYQEAKHRLKGLPVKYIALQPSLETINQREQQRGDRMIGMGASVYHQMIKDFAADLVIDTGKLTPLQAAQQIFAID